MKRKNIIIVCVLALILEACNTEYLNSRLPAENEEEIPDYSDLEDVEINAGDQTTVVIKFLLPKNAAENLTCADIAIHVSDTSLLSKSAIGLSAIDGATCKLEIDPRFLEVAKDSKVTVTLSVNDSDGNPITTEFEVLVIKASAAALEKPVISKINNLVLTINSTSTEIPFELSGEKEVARCNKIQVRTSSALLLPTANVQILGASGQDCRIRITATGSPGGPIKITLMVSGPSPGFSTQRSFNVTINLPPELVLGQPTFNQKQGLRKGLSGPESIAVVGTRLFVADHSNHRVLVWNTFPTTSGEPADFALGQPDLASNDPGLSASRMQHPSEVYSDGIRLFVADTSNSRILVWNTLPTADGEPADFALGQPDLDSGTINNGGSSASSMNRPESVYFDGTRLYVADTLNSRVLIWNTLPTVSGQAADLVLGQPDLTSVAVNNGGVSAASLAGPTGVFSDGTRLFVADSSNSRVLIWNTLPLSTAVAADLVLGQPNMTVFTINNGGVSASSMYYPRRVYREGSNLYVADFLNSRVLVWSSLPAVDGQAADFVLGQPDVNSAVSNNGGLSAASLEGPTSVYVDGSKLLVADSSNNRILIWDSVPSLDGEAADLALGQQNLTSNTANSIDLSASTIKGPAGIHCDGTRLFVADTSNNRVLVWNSMPSSNNAPADFALGQPDLFSAAMNNGGISASTMSLPSSVYFDGTRLFVADSANNRVLVWNSLPDSDGEAADIALGQVNLSSNAPYNGGFFPGTPPTSSTLLGPSGVFSDGNRLFVADQTNHRVLVWDPIPSATGEAADFALGQPGLTSGNQNNGGLSAASLYSPSSIHSDGTRLYIADQDNNRVLVWDALPSFSGEPADFALGQPDLTSNAVNNGGLSASSLSSPNGVFTIGTKLFISDASNNRVLSWNALPSFSGAAADSVFGQPDAASNTANNGGISADTLWDPRAIYSNGLRLFITDLENNRVLVKNLY